MFKKLSYAITALLLLWASPSTAQFRAVYFDRDTLLFNNGGVIARTPSYGGTVSYWYNSTYPTTTAIINVGVSPSTNASSLQVMHKYFAGYGMRFVLRVSSAGQEDVDKSMTWVGETNLPYDGVWHNIVAVWDTLQGIADWEIDGQLTDWDFDNLSRLDSPPFAAVYDSARWFVGGSPSGGAAPYVALLFGQNRSLFLSPTVFKYAGNLAELYLHIGDNDWATLIGGPAPMGGGFGEHATIFGMNIARPVELGLACSTIYGRGDLPSLCMRGDAVWFPVNLGPGTGTDFVVQGTLQTATTDPFQQWQMIP